MLHSILSFILVSIALLLASCSSTPKQPDTSTSQKNTSVFEQTLKQNNLNELEQETRTALKNQDWPEFISLSHQLWQQAKPSDQIAIEYTVWNQLNQLPPKKLSELKQNGSIDMQDWIELVEVTQIETIWQKQAIRDLQEFHGEAIYNTHLTEQLLKRLYRPHKIKQIAVLLPFSGPYAKISIQIRNGMIRNQLLNSPDTELRFYDTSQTEQIAPLYKLAKQNGAEVILGPIQKKSIEQLEKINDKNLITLNKSINHSSFSYRSASESWQISQKLCDKNYANLAILTSTQKSDYKLAQEIGSYWKQQSDGQLVLKTYPVKNPNLRKALGSVINEEQSQSRKDNLQWLLKENLFYKPRTRQDLDAIVLLGNNRQIAVFKPQFDFFELSLPIYSSSKITPSKLSSDKPNKDLRNVNFPSFTAALNPSSLQTKFEAFGWDSFTIATHQQQFGSNTCLNSGQTGRLFKDGKEYDRLFIWAKYDLNGIPQRISSIPTTPYVADQ